MTTDAMLDDLQRQYADRATILRNMANEAGAALGRHRARMKALDLQMGNAKQLKNAAAGLNASLAGIFTKIGFDPAQRQEQVQRWERLLAKPSSFLSPVSLGGIRSFFVTPLPRSKVNKFETALKKGRYGEAERIMKSMEPAGLRGFLLGAKGRAEVNNAIRQGLALVQEHKQAKAQLPALKKSYNGALMKMARQIDTVLRSGKSADYIAALRSSGDPRAAHIASVLESCQTAVAHKGFLTGRAGAIKNVLAAQPGGISSVAWTDGLAHVQSALDARYHTLSTERKAASLRVTACKSLQQQIERRMLHEVYMPFGATRQSIADLLERARTGGPLEAQRDTLFRSAGKKAERFINLADLQHDVDAVQRDAFAVSSLRWKGPGIVKGAAAGVNTAVHTVAGGTVSGAAWFRDAVRALHGMVMNTWHDMKSGAARAEPAPAAAPG